MNYTENDLKHIIAQGENSGIEFKSVDVRAESIAKEIVAFANSNGGIIIIGVEDDKTISGIKKDKYLEEWIMNIARNNINPSINLECQEIHYADKIVSIVTVPKGKDKPYQTNEGKFYIRIGSSNRLASVNELLRLFQQSGVFHFDSTQVENATVQSLNIPKLSKYFETYQINFEL